MFWRLYGDFQPGSLIVQKRFYLGSWVWDCHRFAGGKIVECPEAFLLSK